jgi:hypothetical protein
VKLEVSREDEELLFFSYEENCKRGIFAKQWSPFEAE